MTLINLSNLHKSYGELVLLANASMHIYPGDRIGMVGANGVGKTTLLNIIAGKENVDEGQVSRTRGLTMGYLTQKPGILPAQTLHDFLKGSLKDLYATREKLSSLEEEMACSHFRENKHALDALMKKYGELTFHFESRDGYNMEKRLENVARGLGFLEEDLSRPVSEFSGGEKTRAQLASLLLEDYDLLLLDEPTNNLDLDALQWLEKFLSSQRSAYLIVSHDRYFLDRTVNRIAVLDNRNLRVYKGNYTAYTNQKQIEDATGEKALKKQQEVLKKELDFIQNASSDEKRRAQSREKRMEKVRTGEQPRRIKSIKPKFGFAGRSGKIALSMENVSKSFGQLTVFHDISFTLFWGNRVAVVGPNGAGKTTLLRMVTGSDAPDSGKITPGPGVRMAYYDQEQAYLDLSHTVLENILNSSNMTEPEARKYLGGYLFRGDSVFKKASTLSGGEKSRLALAKTTLGKSNFLVLDEPTNFLDIDGMEQLEKSLEDYPGTLLLVSHDRFLISRIAKQVLEIANGTAAFYPVTYPEYLERKERESEKATAGLEEAKNSQRLIRQEQREKEKQKRQDSMARRRERRRLSESLVNLEQLIQNEENNTLFLEKNLSEPGIYENFEEARAIMEQLHISRETVARLYREWEDTAEKLEKMPGEDGVIV